MHINIIGMGLIRLLIGLFLIHISFLASHGKHMVLWSLSYHWGKSKFLCKRTATQRSSSAKVACRLL